MKKLDKLLKGHKHICFLDFEGTQFSHEMIALGAVMATLDKKGAIKSTKLPYKVFVRAHNKIGNYVTNLTGITEDQLKEQGISFSKAMEGLKKYCGMAFSKCTFCTFGNHDMRILSQSIAYNFDFPKEIVSQIQKNYLDYSAFISEFIKDDKGNPLSLIHYCEKFEAEIVGPNHDPSSDAVNLCTLYNAFIKKSELVGEEYKKVLGNFSRVPEVVKPIIAKLLNGEEVTPREFDDEIKKFLS
ncbi:MAG: hypothetical protein MJZ37_02850 [Bacilli bacterium]|nr:hypothetical protein [Bacilli bacterium]